LSLPSRAISVPPVLSHLPLTPPPPPLSRFPVVENDVFVAPNASVVGRVTVGMQSSIWYGAVVRGDNSDVAIGRFTAIKDRAVISTSKSAEGHAEATVRIGDHVIVGTGAMLQSCVVEDCAEIGAGAIVLEGALVEKNAKVGEGAVVHPGRRIPAGQLWAGNPAVYVRDLSKTEVAEAEGHAEEIAESATEHAHEFLPSGSAYRNAEAMGLK
jgi:carbonic anhydrase/acetyltransferase-like protein (isoleucine patch superfamily)